MRTLEYTVEAAENGLTAEQFLKQLGLSRNVISLLKSVPGAICADGKPARTYYRVLETRGDRSLLRLRLETGRTHQIRVHLCALGCPVAGDFLYGTELDDLPGRFALHSALLRLRHPVTGEWIERESPLPSALSALLSRE